MIELVGAMWVLAIFFAIIGFLRGVNKEIISTAGIILALFALFQFDQYIRGTLLVNVPARQIFLFQAVVFLVVVFFAYQTRALGMDEEEDAGRDNIQSGVLGAIVGFINGYLIWGSLWYFLDINLYPLEPYIIAPAEGSASQQALDILPLVLLGGGPAGSGDALAVVVIVLFFIVLVII